MPPYESTTFGTENIPHRNMSTSDKNNFGYIFSHISDSNDHNCLPSPDHQTILIPNNCAESRLHPIPVSSSTKRSRCLTKLLRWPTKLFWTYGIHPLTQHRSCDLQNIRIATDCYVTLHSSGRHVEGVCGWSTPTDVICTSVSPTSDEDSFTRQNWVRCQ